MYQLAWLAVLAFGISAGALTAIALAVRRRWVVLAGLGASISASGLFAAIGFVWTLALRFDTVVAASFIGAGAAAGGYALYAAVLPRLFRPRAPGRSAPVEAGTRAIEMSRPAIVVLSDAEPTDYDPRAVSAMLVRNEEAGAPLPPGLATPLVYAAERSRYARLGQSPARATVSALAEALSRALIERGRSCDVEVAYCENGPSLTGVISRLAESGHAPIGVLMLTVARTFGFAEALAVLQGPPAASAQVIEIAEPLWTSPDLVNMVSDRIVRAADTRVGECGVCLALPGEPLELERAGGASSEQLLYFAERVRVELVDAGIPAERIRRGWIQWEEPDVLEAARHLSAVGASHVIFAPLAYPAETTQTLLDLRYAAERAAADTGVTTAVLNAWDDDPVVVSVLADQAIATLDRALESAAVR